MLTNKADPESLVALAMAEMKEKNNIGVDCWLSKVKKLKAILGFIDYPGHLLPNSLGKKS